MSQFSETIGSFIRTGNYPLEANYLFPTEAALKEFYKDPINKTTLHNGLLKIVLGDKLSLYWVTLNKTTNELEFKILLLEDSIETLLNKILDLKTTTKDNLNEIDEDLNEIRELLEIIPNLQESIQNLDNEINSNLDIIKKIIGTDSEDLIGYLDTLDYSNLTEISLTLRDFINVPDYSIQDILDCIAGIRSTLQHNDANLWTELNLTQVGVGLNSDGSFSPDLETKFLKNATSIMNALKTLDSIIYSKLNMLPVDTNTATINITTTEDNITTISARVKMSADSGNDIKEKSDGLYCNIDSEYANGILTIKVNGDVRLQHNLALSSIVNTARYDTATETIIIEFALLNGSTLIVEIPVANLITEWEVANKSNSAVELTRERNISGTDQLSADVRLSTNEYNILEKDNNTLLVRGDSAIFIPISPDNLQVPTDMGDITQGTTASELKGKTVSEILDSILFKTIYPTVTLPSASIGHSNTNTIVEAGSTILTGLTHSLNKGRVIVSDGVTANREYVGSETSHTYYVKTIGGTANTNAGVSAYPSNNDVLIDTLTRYEPGTYLYKVAINYSEGPTMVTSKGRSLNPMPITNGEPVTNPHPAGSITSSYGVIRNVTLPVWMDYANGSYVKQSLKNWGAMTFTGISFLNTSKSNPIKIKTPRKLQSVNSYNAVSGRYDVPQISNFIINLIVESVNGRDYVYYEYIWNGGALAAVNMEVKTY